MNHTTSITTGTIKIHSIWLLCWPFYPCANKTGFSMKFRKPNGTAAETCAQEPKGIILFPARMKISADIEASCECKPWATVAFWSEARLEAAQHMIKGLRADIAQARQFIADKPENKLVSFATMICGAIGVNASATPEQAYEAVSVFLKGYAAMEKNEESYQRTIRKIDLERRRFESEVAELRQQVYMPGDWKCDTCGFMQHNRVLNPETGECGARKVEEIPICPNKDGSPMRRMTWKEGSESNYEAAMRFMSERDGQSAFTDVLATAAGSYLKEADILLKEDAKCDHEVGICYCSYHRAHDALASILKQVSIPPEDRLRKALQMVEDSHRMDWIEAQTDGNGWEARQSSTGRGFRMHNSRSADASITARIAIDSARGRNL